MNILYNIHGYKPAYNIGGPILSVSALAEGLVRRGHRVMVAATDSNLTERLQVDTDRWHDLDGVLVRYFRVSESWTKMIPSEYFRNTRGDYRTRGLTQWLANSDIKFDVIHSHLPFVHGNRVLAAHAAHTQTPYFYHQRGVFDPVRLNHRAWKKKLAINLWEKRICRKADVLIALTDYERQSYRSLGLQNRIEVVPNGIAIPAKTHHAWPFPEFPVKSDDVLVLFMSRLHRIKGPDLAVEAFCSVLKQAPHAKMIVAGPDDDEMTSRLAAMVSQSLAQRSVFFSGPIKDEVKAAVLARADVFVLPTESEGFSMAILEALANSCAVVTTPNAYFPDIERASAGLICERTSTALATALARLMTNVAATRRMGDSARSLVEREYSWSHIVDRLEALYDEVLQQRRRH